MRQKLATGAVALSVLYGGQASASQSCLIEEYTALWAERIGIGIDAARVILQAPELQPTMYDVLSEVYSTFLENALELESGHDAYELFSVQWNISSHQQRDYDLVTDALRKCVDWMWAE